MSDAAEAVREENERKTERPTRKVAILGTATSSLEYAPVGDESWEVWGCSQLYGALPRWDVWFELHSLNYLAERGDRDSFIEWLQQDHGPDRAIYARDEVALAIPCGVPYPLEAILETFPSGYFTNTISYMLALAIFQRVDQIGVWGVDMALESEYGDQRPSCEYFIGLARGAGIPVHVPDQADLLKTRKLYGFDDPDGFEKSLQARKKELRRELNQMEQQIQQLKGRHQAYQGAMDQVKWDLQNHEHSYERETSEIIGR